MTRSDFEKGDTMSNKKQQRDACAMECAGNDIFIIFNGVRIAKRGYPDTPQAKTWVSLEPGWRVLDGPNGDSIAIEHDDGVGFTDGCDAE